MIEYGLIDFDFNQKRYIKSTNLVNGLSDKLIYLVMPLKIDVNELDLFVVIEWDWLALLRNFILGLDLMREANLVDKEDLYKIQQRYLIIGQRN